MVVLQVQRLGLRGLPFLALGLGNGVGLHAVANGLEQLALLRFEAGALIGKLWGRGRRRCRAHVGELLDEWTVEVHRHDVRSVANEEDALAVGGKGRAAFAGWRLGEPPGGGAAQVHEPEVAVHRYHAAKAIGRQRTLRDERCDGVHVRLRHLLGCGAGLGTHTVGFERFVPGRARREPVEVNPLPVGGEPRVLRFPAVELRPSHHVGDGEVKAGALLRRGGARKERGTQGQCCKTTHDADHSWRGGL